MAAATRNVVVLIKMAGRAGFEPATKALTAPDSTTELPPKRETWSDLPGVPREPVAPAEMMCRAASSEIEAAPAAREMTLTGAAIPPRAGAVKGNDGESDVICSPVMREVSAND